VSDTEKVPVVGQLTKHTPKPGWDRNLPEVQEVQLVAELLQVLQYEIAESHSEQLKPFV
jgi:hypothetical protein